MIYDEGLMDNFRFHAVPECSLPNRLSVRSIIRGTGNRSIDTGCAETAADIDQPAKVCSFPVGRLDGQCMSRMSQSLRKLYLGLAQIRKYQR
jgi:hypothetical protein